MKRYPLLVLVAFAALVAFALGSTVLADDTNSGKKVTTVSAAGSGKTCAKVCQDKASCSKTCTATECKDKGTCTDTCKAACTTKSACAKHQSGTCKPGDCKQAHCKVTSSK